MRKSRRGGCRGGREGGGWEGMKKGDVPWWVGSKGVSERVYEVWERAGRVERGEATCF